MAIVLAMTTPVRGYHIDPHGALPTAYWPLMALSFSTASGAYAAGTDWSRRFAAGLLLGCFLEAMLLPTQLGIATYGRYDQMTHLGIIQDILDEGGSDSSNFYPATHLLYTALGVWTGLPVLRVSLLGGALFSIVFVWGCLAFYRTTFPRLFLVASPWLLPSLLILYHGWSHFSIIPNFVFYSLIPATLAVHRMWRIEGGWLWTTSLMLMLAISVFGHPFVTLFWIAYLGYDALRSWLLGRPLSLFAFAIFTIGSAAWILFGEGLEAALVRAASAATSGELDSVAAKGVGQASRITPSAAEMVSIVWFLGARFLVPFGFVALLGARVLRARVWRGHPEASEWRHLAEWGFLLVGLQAALLLNGIVSHTPNRLLNISFVTLLLPLCFALALAWRKRRDGRGRPTLRLHGPRPGFVASSLLLGILFATSLAGAMDSPRSFTPANTMHANEMTSAAWLLEHKDPSALALDVQGSFLYRQAWYHMGRDVEEPDARIPKALPIPDHFAGDLHGLADSDHYVIFTSIGRQLYTTLYDEIGRFTDADFEAVEESRNYFLVYQGRDTAYLLRA
ncbi:MAG: hypothetical protein ACPGQL_09605 [Thermoplasmatota archaeon]